jgi:hypothetical protein
MVAGPWVIVRGRVAGGVGSEIGATDRRKSFPAWLDDPNIAVPNNDPIATTTNKKMRFSALINLNPLNSGKCVAVTGQ